MILTLDSPAPAAAPAGDRLDELAAFVAQRRRPPRRRALSTAERSLAEWMVQQAGRRDRQMAIRRVLSGMHAPVPVAATKSPAAPVRRQRPAAAALRATPVTPVVTTPVVHVEAGDRTPIQWLRELQQFMDTYHRLPMRDAVDPTEQELGRWTHRARREKNQFVAVAISFRGLR